MRYLACRQAGCQTSFAREWIFPVRPLGECLQQCSLCLRIFIQPRWSTALGRGGSGPCHRCGHGLGPQGQHTSADLLRRGRFRLPSLTSSRLERKSFVCRLRTAVHLLQPSGAHAGGPAKSGSSPSLLRVALRSLGTWVTMVLKVLPPNSSCPSRILWSWRSRLWTSMVWSFCRHCFSRLAVSQ